jgi:DNA-binding MarR family transcriptional regulator
MRAATDPHDRRARRPELTAAGDTVRATLADACAGVEAAALRGFGPEQERTFRRMLVEIIGESEDRGSCL